MEKNNGPVKRFKEKSRGGSNEGIGRNGRGPDRHCDESERAPNETSREARERGSGPFRQESFHLIC